MVPVSLEVAQFYKVKVLSDILYKADMTDGVCARSTHSAAKLAGALKIGLYCLQALLCQNSQYDLIMCQAGRATCNRVQLLAALSNQDDAKFCCRDPRLT